MTIDTATWAWPQWTFVVIVLLDLVIGGIYHGTPRPNYNVGYKIFDAIVWTVILTYGGFFS